MALPYISGGVGRGVAKVGASDEVGGILHIKRHLYLYLTAAHLLSALPRRLAHWDVPTLIHYVSRGWGSFSRGMPSLSRARSDEHQKRRRSRMTIFKSRALAGATLSLPPPSPRRRRRQGVAAIQASINPPTASQLVPAGRCQTLRRPLQRSQALPI